MIRVGLVGASIARGGWAIRAHVPAIAALGDVALHAVATTREASAQEAAEAFGAEKAYVGAAALAADPDVDLVVASVNIREHAGVVRAAADAGKPVLCDWPLGLNLGEAEELAALTRRAGVRNFIGLQARHAPAVQHTRALIADGYVGDLRSATFYMADPFLGLPEIPQSMEWMTHAENSIGILAIPGMHGLDALCACAGEIADVSAVVATLDPRVRIAETGETVDRTIDDHVVVAGRLDSGAVFAAHLQGGCVAAPESWIEVRGTNGVLRVVGQAGTQLQIGSVTLLGARGRDPLAPVSLPEEVQAAVPESVRNTPAENFACFYSAVAAALRGESSDVADFDDALIRHRMIAATLSSSQSGRREPVAP